MKRALITGGAGFIGSHLATHLIEAGWNVRLLDDFSTGKRSNLAHLASMIGRLEVIDASMLEHAPLAEAMRDVDVVFHLAAMVSVPQSVADPMRCHELCATGTLRVLLAARQAKVRRLVYSGSSSAYGNSSEGAIGESAPLDPLSPYAAGKLAGEHYCSVFAELGEIETVRLRYFNVFGPRQDPSSPYSGVISIFLSKMLAGQSPTIFGDGLQSRDFVFVENVAIANLLAATKEGVSGRVYNIGAGGRISLLDLVASINEVLGTKLEPRFGAPRAGDVRHSQADIAAARRDLDYSPAVDFQTGLARTLEYYRAAAAG